MRDSFTYSAKQLLNVKKWLDENPDGVINVPVFGMRPLTKDEWHAWFMQSLHNKINRNQPKRGRKDSHDWFMEMLRTSREVNTPRLIVRWVPAELRTRLAHRIWNPEWD